jgi:hypothetical protein
MWKAPGRVGVAPRWRRVKVKRIAQTRKREYEMTLEISNLEAGSRRSYPEISMMGSFGAMNIHSMPAGQLETGTNEIIGNSPALESVRAEVGRVAPTNSTVLVKYALLGRGHAVEDAQKQPPLLPRLRRWLVRGHILYQYRTLRMRLRNSCGSESSVSSTTLTKCSRFILHPLK